MNSASWMNRVLLFAMRLLSRLWQRNNLRQNNPRLWSNDELAGVAGLFGGAIVNVSAGKDNDKEGRAYRDYFGAARSYAITNYFLEFEKTGEYEETHLDLAVPISTDAALYKKFDVVLNHTVLEHVYDIKKAIQNLCRISKDVVITIVPFLQELHHIPEQFNDYWRVSPYSLAGLFQEAGFETLYVNWNSDPLGNIYIFHIASCQPAHWREKIRPARPKYGPGFERQFLKTDGAAGFDRLAMDYQAIYRTPE